MRSLIFLSLSLFCLSGHSVAEEAKAVAGEDPASVEFTLFPVPIYDGDLISRVAM